MGPNHNKNRLPLPPIGLEANVIKLRSLEMSLILLYVEDIKQTSILLIETNNAYFFLGELPEKRKAEKAFDILVEHNFISAHERKELKTFIDYRNDIAHRIHELMADVFDIRGWAPIKYRRNSLKRIQHLREKIRSIPIIQTIKMSDISILDIEDTMLREIKKLEAKIISQLNVRTDMIKKVNNELALPLPKNMIHPQSLEYTNSRGHLTPEGLAACQSLFDSGRSPESVAYLMDISLRTAKNNWVKWSKIKTS